MQQQGAEGEALGVPGMAELASKLQAAAVHATAWEASVLGVSPQSAPTFDSPASLTAAPSSHTANAAPLTHTSSAAASEATAFGQDLESAVSTVLIWAQGLDAAAKAVVSQDTPASDEAVASGEDAAAVAGVCF